MLRVQPERPVTPKAPAAISSNWLAARPVGRLCSVLFSAGLQRVDFVGALLDCRLIVATAAGARGPK